MVGSRETNNSPSLTIPLEIRSLMNIASTATEPLVSQLAGGGVTMWRGVRRIAPSPRFNHNSLNPTLNHLPWSHVPERRMSPPSFKTLLTWPLGLALTTKKIDDGILILCVGACFGRHSRKVKKGGGTKLGGKGTRKDREAAGNQKEHSSLSSRTIQH